tara:strand:+ start:1267 stop:2106 length:840 start_codon:yes stop_codon:yes gene_type:complete
MKKVFFNLNLDDIHPQSSVVGQDFGGDRESGVFKYLFELIAKYPKIKITLFTVPNYQDKSNDSFFVRNCKKLFGLNYRNKWKDEPFKLTKHKEWCKWLSSHKNFEIAMHGFSHHNEKFGLHQQEFESLSFEESLDRLQKAEQLFKDAGLKYVRGFRPPGWGSSNGMFEALRHLKMDFTALHAKKFPGVNNFSTTKFGDLVNVPSNWDIRTGTIADAKRILEHGDLISADGHIAEYSDKDSTGNGINAIRVKNIIELLDWLQKEYIVEFVSMSDLVKQKK